MNFDWTDERIEQLKALTADGLSGSQIAAVMHVPTRNAVIGKQHRLGLAGLKIRPPRRTDASVLDKIKRKPGVDGSMATNIKIRHAAPPARPPKPVPPPVPETIEPLNIPFMARRMGKDCAFITTDGSPWLCCGHPVSEGEYCAVHARRCFNGYGRPESATPHRAGAGLGVSPKDHLRAGSGAAEAAGYIAVQGDQPAHQSSEAMPWQS